jgi:hypothetical protein
MANESFCTDFCNRLRTLSLEAGTLPLHDELASHLGFTDENQHGQRLGTLNELRQRLHCGFCRLALLAVLDGQRQMSEEEFGEQQPIDIILFPNEQSFRLSYPSRMGTRIAFVAEENHQSSGPDTGRLVRGSEIRPSQILEWLRKCNEHHGKACCSHFDYPVSSII